jgi:hypothetical protein
MKYKAAREMLRHAIHSQKTIQTSKLAVIIQSMGISLKKGDESAEVKLLKASHEELRADLEAIQVWANKKGYVLPKRGKMQ